MSKPNLVWADDNRTIYYIEKDPVTLLSKRVKAHVLGTPASADKLVYEEKDDSFYMGVGRTSDDKYHLHLRAEHGQQRAALHQRRQPGRIRGGRAARARLPLRRRPCRRPLDHPHQLERAQLQADDAQRRRCRAGGRAAWTDLVAHDPDVFIENFKPFDSFIAIEQRSGGNKQIRLLANDGTSSDVASDEPAYAMSHRRQSRSRHDQAALHLRFADHAADHL